jgi:predicted transcriptional regulator
MLGLPPDKPNGTAEESKGHWLSQIKEFASSDVLSVQEDRKVVDHVDDLMSWKIDFVVVKDKGKVIQGVIGRDQLTEIMTEKKLQIRKGKDIDLSQMSFRDVIETENLKEYYVINEDAAKNEAPLWQQGLPAREILIIKDKIVKAVVDRRWFKKWQRLLRLARSF